MKATLKKRFLLDDQKSSKVIRNKGQLPQYFVAGAHAPIVPKSVFNRAGDEMFLRRETAGIGGTHFGSRQSLKGRTWCSCGGMMKQMRRKGGVVYKCPICFAEWADERLKRQVLSAWAALPNHRDEIEARLDALEEGLNSEERLTRATAQHEEWRLRNLLPARGALTYGAACYDEEDFRARTGKQTGEWSDGWMVSVLVKVVAGVETEFNGGVIVPVESNLCSV